MKRALAIILSAVLFGGVAGATIVGITKLAGAGSEISAMAEPETSGTETDESGTAAETETGDTTDTAAASEQAGTDGTAMLDVSAIVEEAMPQVVSITNTMVIEQQGYGSIFDYFYGGGYTQEYEVPASGSGVIVDKTDTELLIATNDHVIEDSKELSVTFIDGTTVDAAVKGSDSDMDIAVIAVPLESISDETMSQIKVATLHTEEDLKVGQGVIAIGNALGYGQTVTVGYISALDREISAEGTDYSGLIQTDAAINPGNSGGALLNMQGEVIGINVAKLTDTSVEGIGYSIPIYKAAEVIEEMFSAKTKVEIAEENQGRLGIYMRTVTDDYAKALGIPEGVIVKGFSDELVSGYTEDDVQESPARAAGFQKNDIITKFDGQKISDSEQLSGMMKYYEAGSEVEVTVERLEDGNYVEKVLTVTLGSKNDPKIAPVASEEESAENAAGGSGSAQQAPETNADENAGDSQPSGDGSAEPQEGSTSEDDIYELFKNFLEQYQ